MSAAADLYTTLPILHTHAYASMRICMGLEFFVGDIPLDPGRVPVKLEDGLAGYHGFVHRITTITMHTSQSYRVKELVLISFMA